MNVDQMREEIKKAYGGATWKIRVNSMPSTQVIAIYYKFKKTGKLDAINKHPKNVEEYVQMTIWDYLKEKNDEYSNKN